MNQNLREKIGLVPGRYVEIWSNPFYLIPVTLMMSLGSLALLIPIHESTADGKWIGYIACSGTFLSTVLYFNIYFTPSFDIYLEADQIRTHGMFRQVFKFLPEWNLRYEDIERIEAHSNFGAWMIKLIPRAGSSGRRLYLGTSIIDFGDFFEQVLERSVNCREIKNAHLIEKFMRPQTWKKEPDRALINRAIRRAEESAKKAAV